MNDDPSVQFLTARPRKRRHHQMSSSPYHRIESPRAQQGESSSSRAPRSPHTGPTLPPMRYPGDGLDFRRPAMSSREPDPVIDLTNEPDSSPQQPPLRRSSSGPASRNARQPRFGRDILAEPDVVNLVDEPDSPGDRDPPRSPEVEFVRATTRPHRMHGFGQSMLRLMRRVATQDNYNEDLVWQNRYLRARSRPVDMETFFIGEGAGHGIDVELNFGGLSPAPPQSSYKPPSPPPKGFTRSAGEKDVVVCPNCDMELGTGDEEKQQIWVVKQCGHVYCGECARHRSLTKSKKNAQKTKPFAKCQIPDCEKPVSPPKSMIQVYL